MSKDEFRRMIIAEGMMSGGNPLPEDQQNQSIFQPKPMGVLPDKDKGSVWWYHGSRW